MAQQEWNKMKSTNINQVTFDYKYENEDSDDDEDEISEENILKKIKSFMLDDDLDSDENDVLDNDNDEDNEDGDDEISESDVNEISKIKSETLQNSKNNHKDDKNKINNEVDKNKDKLLRLDVDTKAKLELLLANAGVESITNDLLEDPTILQTLATTYIKTFNEAVNTGSIDLTDVDEDENDFNQNTVEIVDSIHLLKHSNIIQSTFEDFILNSSASEIDDQDDVYKKIDEKQNILSGHENKTIALCSSITETSKINSNLLNKEDILAKSLINNTDSIDNGNENSANQSLIMPLTHKKSITGKSLTDILEENADSILGLACASGYIELVTVLLAVNANVEDRGQKNEKTPLMEACLNGHKQIVELLINHGANVNSKSLNGNTPLHFCIQENHVQIVEMLIKNSANIEETNNNGHTPLMEAAFFGCFDSADMLLKFGANVNAQSVEFKETALTIASYKGHVDIVKLLLEHGADISHTTDEMHTPLIEACFNGHVEVAKILLVNGASVNKPFNSFESPLTLSASGGHTVLAALLIEHGANPSTERNGEGHTPLMVASYEGHEEMVALLLFHGAEINTISEETQETALTLACSSGSYNIAKFLINAEADVNLGATTPLMKASNSGHIEIVKLLLISNALVNQCNSTGETALSLACENGHTNIVELLIKAGAYIDLPDSEKGYTPLMKAVKSGHIFTVQYLLNAGANVNQITSLKEHNALSLACLNSHLLIAELLLINNADVSTVLKDNSNCLIEAVKGGNVDIVKLILEWPSTELSSKVCQHISLIERMKTSFEKPQNNTNITENDKSYESPQNTSKSLVYPTNQSDNGRINSEVPLEAFVNVLSKLNVDDDILSNYKESTFKDTSKSCGKKEDNLKTEISSTLKSCDSAHMKFSHQELSKLRYIKSLKKNNRDNRLRKQPNECNYLPCEENKEASLNYKDDAVVLKESNDIDCLPALSIKKKSFDCFSGISENTKILNEGFDITRENSYRISKPDNEISPNYVQLHENEESSIKDNKNDNECRFKTIVTSNKILIDDCVQKKDNVDIIDSKQQINEIIEYNTLKKNNRKLEESLIHISKENGLNSDDMSHVTSKTLISSGFKDTDKSDINTLQTVKNMYNKSNNGLKKASIDIELETDNRDTAFILACIGCHEEIVKLLLLNGANVEHRDKKGFTPLILCASAGFAKLVEMLLKHGADIEAKSERSKDTALTAACQSGKYEVVDLLLKHGANKEHRNINDYTPLSLAASGGYVHIIKNLIHNEAEINSRADTTLGISPLMLASMNGHVQATKLLLEMGADVNAQIKTNRNTALTLACSHGRSEIVKLLLERRANIEHRNKNGNTPLIEAAFNGYENVGKVLIEKGADINATTIVTKDTSLIVASDKGHYKFVQLLLEKGALIDLKNKKGCSALWQTCTSNHLEICQLLVSNGANPDAEDLRHISCLIAAFRKGYTKIVKYLVRYVKNFPPDADLLRYTSTVIDNDLSKTCSQCVEIIIAAKEKQAQEANKAASSLLREIDLEKDREKSKKEAAARKREKRKQKKKKQQKLTQDQQYSKQSNTDMHCKSDDDYDDTDSSQNNKFNTAELKQTNKFNTDELKQTLNRENIVKTEKALEINSEKKSILMEEKNNTNQKDIIKKQLGDVQNKLQHHQNINRIEESKSNIKIEKKLKKLIQNLKISQYEITSSKNNTEMEKKPILDMTPIRSIKHLTQESNRNVIESSSLADLDNFEPMQINNKSSKISEAKENFSKYDNISSCKRTNEGLFGKKFTNWKEKHIAIENEKYLSVIKKINSNMKIIHETTGAYFEVNNQKNYSNQRTIIIRGTDEAVKYACNLLLALIRNPMLNIADLLASSKIINSDKMNKIKDGIVKSNHHTNSSFNVKIDNFNKVRVNPKIRDYSSKRQLTTKSILNNASELKPTKDLSTETSQKSKKTIDSSDSNASLNNIATYNPLFSSPLLQSTAEYSRAKPIIIVPENNNFMSFSEEVKQNLPGKRNFAEVARQSLKANTSSNDVSIGALKPNTSFSITKTILPINKNTLQPEDINKEVLHTSVVIPKTNNLIEAKTNSKIPFNNNNYFVNNQDTRFTLFSNNDCDTNFYNHTNYSLPSKEKESLDNIYLNQNSCIIKSEPLISIYDNNQHTEFKSCLPEKSNESFPITSSPQSDFYVSKNTNTFSILKNNYAKTNSKTNQLTREPDSFSDIEDSEQNLKQNQFNKITDKIFDIDSSLCKYPMESMRTYNKPFPVPIGHERQKFHKEQNTKLKIEATCIPQNQAVNEFNFRNTVELHQRENMNQFEVQSVIFNPSNNNENNFLKMTTFNEFENAKLDNLFNSRNNDIPMFSGLPLSNAPLTLYHTTIPPFDNTKE